MYSQSFDPDDVSVVLQCYLERANDVPVRSSSDRVRALLAAPSVLAALHRELPLPTGADTADILRNETYHSRLSEVVGERERIGAGAPTLRLAPAALTRAEVKRVLPGETNLALLFAAETVLFQDTLHALASDALAMWSAAGPRVNVLAVRLDWRTPDHRRAVRAMIVDGSGLVKEVAFGAPVPMHVAVTLHLPREAEQALHARVSAECRAAGIPEINPHGASLRADDKWAGYELWAGAPPSVHTPRSWLIPRCVDEPAVQRVTREAFALGSPLYVQPRHGTEGRAVARFERHQIGACTRHVLGAIFPGDDALLREERGNVWLSRATPAGRDDPRRIALRIHVAWDGRRFLAESGFAQVAGDEEPDVASRGRGGSIVGIGEALRSLWHHDGTGWRRVRVTAQDLADLRRACEAAMAALNRGLRAGDCLRHAGLDVVLEVTDAGRLLPIILEANPRPAGLNHSRWLPRAPADDAPLGVTRALFRPGYQSEYPPSITRSWPVVKLDASEAR